MRINDEFTGVNARRQKDYDLATKAERDKVIDLSGGNADQYSWSWLVEIARAKGYKGWAGVKPDGLSSITQLNDFRDVLSAQQFEAERTSLLQKAFIEFRQSLGLESVKEISKPEDARSTHNTWQPLPLYEQDYKMNIPDGALGTLERLNQIYGELNPFDGSEQPFICDYVNHHKYHYRSNDTVTLVPNAETPEEAERILNNVFLESPCLLALTKYGFEAPQDVTLDIEKAEYVVTSLVKKLQDPKYSFSDEDLSLANSDIETILKRHGFDITLSSKPGNFGKLVLAYNALAPGYKEVNLTVPNDALVVTITDQSGDEHAFEIIKDDIDDVGAFLGYDIVSNVLDTMYEETHPLPSSRQNREPGIVAVYEDYFGLN